MRHSIFDDVENLYKEVTSQGNWYNSFEDGLKRVREGNFALIVEKDLAEYVTKRPPCDIVIVGEPLAEIGYAFAMPMNEPQKHAFDLAMLELREMGEIKKITDKYWKDDQCQNGYPSSQASSSSSYIVTVFTFIIHLIGKCT